jgi:hypothetical protein
MCRWKKWNKAGHAEKDKVMFIRLIIRTIYFIFLARIILFSHNKSANSVFSRFISTAERGKMGREMRRLKNGANADKHRNN